MSRYQTSTERLRFGAMKPIYMHSEYDAQGRLVSIWYSCSTKHLGTDFEDLLRAISERTQTAIDEARKP